LAKIKKKTQKFAKKLLFDVDFFKEIVYDMRWIAIGCPYIILKNKVIIIIIFKGGFFNE
jgi:hypothetical protein